MCVTVDLQGSTAPPNPVPMTAVNRAGVWMGFVCASLDCQDRTAPPNPAPTTAMTGAGA